MIRNIIFISIAFFLLVYFLSGGTLLFLGKLLLAILAITIFLYIIVLIVFGFVLFKL